MLSIFLAEATGRIHWLIQGTKLAVLAIHSSSHSETHIYFGRCSLNRFKTHSLPPHLPILHKILKQAYVVLKSIVPQFLFNFLVKRIFQVKKQNLLVGSLEKIARMSIPVI